MTLITKQQAFDTAVQGLYAQGEPAADSYGKCQYRVKTTGHKCGVGFLIPDDVYQSRFESLSASRVFETSPAFNKLFDPEMDNIFLTVLQTDLHDNYVEDAKDSEDAGEEAIPYKKWLIEQAKTFAKIHDLKVPSVIEEVVS